MRGRAVRIAELLPPHESLLIEAVEVFAHPILSSPRAHACAIMASGVPPRILTYVLGNPLLVEGLVGIMLDGVPTTWTGGDCACSLSTRVPLISGSPISTP